MYIRLHMSKYERNVRLGDQFRYMSLAVTGVAGMLAISNLIGAERAQESAETIAAADTRYAQMAAEVALENAIPVGYSVNGKTPSPTVKLMPQSRMFMAHESVGSALQEAHDRTEHAKTSTSVAGGGLFVFVSSCLTRLRRRRQDSHAAEQHLPQLIDIALSRVPKPTPEERFDQKIGDGLVALQEALAHRADMIALQQANTTMNYRAFDVPSTVINTNSLIPAA